MIGKVYFHRKHNRLKNFDYSTSGYYYVTVCTNNKAKYFGEINDNKIKLNECGKIVNEHWINIPERYNKVILDEYVIMPNHIHGIIIIKYVGAIFKSPNKIYPSLSNIIKWFKSVSTIEIKKINKTFKWQKSFYDHIIRNEYSLFKIRQYIRDNPIKWDLDDLIRGFDFLLLICIIGN